MIGIAISSYWYLVVVVVASLSSFLRPADPPPPEARNEAEDSVRIPREAYRDKDIAHENDNDGNN